MQDMPSLVLGQLEDIVAIIFLGGIILFPTMALSVRFALKPLLQMYLRGRHEQGEEGRLLQDRRIELLETELRQVQQSLNRLEEADSFQRQISEGRPASGPF